MEGEIISPEEIDYTTLSDVLFMARKNDMAFTAKKRVLVISEHQSTINQNMPLRDSIYFGRTIEQLIEPRALYRNRLIGIPTPEFYTLPGTPIIHVLRTDARCAIRYVFYNGNEVFPKEKIMKLSDSYLDKDKKGMLELEVKIININFPVQHPFLDICRPMFEYSCFVDKLKSYLMKGNTRDEAIVKSMEECREEGILVEFFNKHGAEVSNMLFTEFNMEDALEVRGEEMFEYGMSQGRAEAVIDILEARGKVSEALKSRILSETDCKVLKQWLRMAVKTKSLTKFKESTGL